MRLKECVPIYMEDPVGLITSTSFDIIKTKPCKLDPNQNFLFCKGEIAVVIKKVASQACANVHPALLPLT